MRNLLNSVFPLAQQNGQGSLRSVILLILALMINASGCANTTDTAPETSTPFLERKQTQIQGEIRVSAAVPSARETRQTLGAGLYARGVQPIWLEIENNSAVGVYFLPVGTDPLYFTPIQSAFWAYAKDTRLGWGESSRNFHQSAMVFRVPPNTTRSGFVFTPLDEGTKTFNVDLVSYDKDTGYLFTFFIPVPGLKLDHHEVDWDGLYSEGELQHIDDERALISALENMPCCTTDKRGKDQGDPLNIVVIGTEDDLYWAFLRAGWDETETIHAGSLWKTVVSFFSGGEYRYSPVSGLYVLGRTQDVALQRARENIHERNHLRLWMTPIRFRGTPVWIGQISRDIGVRFTRRTITTHKIDPDVDETREYLLENLAYSQGLKAIGYVRGVGEAPFDSPRGNLTGDPYFTDGYRVVLWIAPSPTDIAKIEVLPWRELP